MIEGKGFLMVSIHSKLGIVFYQTAEIEGAVLFSSHFCGRT